MEKPQNNDDGAKEPTAEIESGGAISSSSDCGSDEADRAGGAAQPLSSVSAADSRSDAATANEKIKRPISQKKLAANRANAQRSTGPKTTAGKANSSKNSYQHGLCAQHLFRPGPQRTQDVEAYQELSARVRDYYRPQGFMEEFLVEKIVTEMVRFARIVGHEQSELRSQFPFYNKAIDKILRYATSSDRQLMRSIRELERIQAARGATSGPSVAVEELDGAAQPTAPSDQGNWDCLGSITPFVESAGGQTGRSSQEGVSPANRDARANGVGPNDEE